MDAETLPARWGIVRAEWLFHPDIGVDELAMLACLSTYLNRQGYCWPSQKTLAARLKKSRPWVIKVLNRLVETGLVIRTRRERKDGGLRSCLYRMPAPNFTGAVVLDDKPSTDAPVVAQEYPERVSSEQACPERDRDCRDGDMNHQHKIQDSLSQERARAQHRERASGKTIHGMVKSCRVARPVPDGWTPSAADLAWAAKAYPDMDPETLTREFVYASQAKGYTYVNLGCAWRSWFANQRRWKEDCHDRFVRSRRGKRSYRNQESPEPPLGSGNTRSSEPRQTAQPDRAVPDQHACQSIYHDGGPQSGLVERNRAAADACLERVLARRAGSSFAGLSSI
jgi:hypothetical protein